MKRVLLGIISVVLALASVFGIFAAGIGLGDVPGIERNKNLQAADIEDAIDLIEENLEDYNAYLEQKDKPVEPEDGEGEEEPAETPEPTPTPTPTPTPAGTSSAAAQSEYGKWQATYSNRQQVVADRQAKYDAAAAKVAEDEAALDAAREILNAVEAKLNAIPSPDAALAAKNEYDSLEQDPRLALGGEIVSLVEGQINTAYAAYQSALGGFATLDELQSAYNNASNAVAAANAEVQRAEQQLATDQAALEAAKKELDNANNELGYAKNQMDNAQAALSNAQAAEVNNRKAEAEKAEKEAADKAAEEAEKTAEKLSELENENDAQSIVEDGLSILLENDDISSRVVDETDAEEVIDAAREYLDETQQNVSKELDLRSKLYTALRLLGYIGAIAGIAGIVVTIVPKTALFIISLVFSSLTALFAIVLNIFGMLGGYSHFVYERASGGGNGDLQLLAMIALLAAAVISVIIVAVCLSAFRKALKMRKIKQQVARMNSRAYR